MRFVSVDLYYIRIASTPNCNSSNYVKFAHFLFIFYGMLICTLNIYLVYLKYISDYDLQVYFIIVTWLSQWYRLKFNVKS